MVFSYRKPSIYSCLSVFLVTMLFYIGIFSIIFDVHGKQWWEEKGRQRGRSIRAQNFELCARRLYYTFASHLVVPDACSTASKFAHVLGNVVSKRWIDARQAAIFYYRPNGAERKRRTAGISCTRMINLGILFVALWDCGNFRKNGI